MKVLITGSDGFVGTHFQAYGYERGWDMDRVDVRWGTNHDVRQWFRTYPDRKYDLVVHLAAVVGGRAQIEGDPLSVAVDLAIDSDLFRWAERAKPGRILYFSSSAAYPVGLQTLVNQHALREQDINLSNVRTPDLTYGWSKLTGEVLASHSSVPVHVVRPFSGYGEDQDPSYPFRAFVDRGRRHEDPFVVWGDGYQTRDFIHIDDVVAGAMAVVDADCRQPVNLGTGIPTNFNTLAQKVMRAAGYEAPIERILSAPKGVDYRVANTTFMRVFYTPKIDLEEGIRRALAT